jgi:HSP20 family protein
MWAEACARLEEAERRHRHFFELLAVPSAAPAWEPPANILSIGQELQVTVALPGARAEQVVAQVTPSGLLIEATVPPPAFAQGVEVVRLEIPYGRMRRRIELPPGGYTLLEFRLDAGYLFLRLTGTNL